MNAVVVYDSTYGNTKAVANAIGSALGGCDVLPVADADLARVLGYDVIVIGSPTHAGRPTPAITAFLNALPPYWLNHLPVATFDTRNDAGREGLALRLFMKALGYAAPRMATALKHKGAQVVNVEGFFVEGKEGPLCEGELARASQWALTLRRTQEQRSASEGGDQ